jgi:hypothetical protein
VANATAKVNKGTVRRQDEFYKRALATLAAETTFYVNAGMGLTTAGYGAKFDDTQSLIFDGVVRGREGNVVMPAATAGDAGHDLDLHQPFRVEVAISGVAKADIGEVVYALFDQTGTLDPTATTYANVWGVVVDVVASGIALVEPAYDGVAGNLRLSAAKWLAATGSQTLTKWDIGKTIFCPNTAAHSVILPAVAAAAKGGRLRFCKTTSDAQIVTLDGADSENIDEATTLTTIDAVNDCAELVNTGVKWIIQSRDIT